jgi:hypothetical protein
MSDIIKTKFLCKTGSQTTSRFGGTWKDRFIENKWYDGEYQTWSEQLFKLNNGWRRYWVVNEQGIKEEISKAQFISIFETDISKLRDNKINEIIK